MVSATFNGMLTWSRWTKWSVAISAPVKLHRIVDQELLLQLRGRRDLRDHVGDDAVVRRLLRHVRMRPVGAPDHAVREALDDGARERHHVVIGRARDGEALRAGHLGDPVLVLVERLQPVLEVLAVHALLHVRAGHVVEHQRGRQRLQERAHLVEISVLEIDHDVPAELGDAVGDPDHHVLRRRIHQPLDEVEAHALDAIAVELLQLLVGEALVHESARPWPGRSTVTSASTSARLSVPWQVACTITALSKPRKSCSANSFSFGASHGVYLRVGRERKSGLRAEHGIVGVHRARRRLVLRL